MILSSNWFQQYPPSPLFISQHFCCPFIFLIREQQVQCRATLKWQEDFKETKGRGSWDDQRPVPDVHQLREESLSAL
jgi:hypothetical protein